MKRYLLLFLAFSFELCLAQNHRFTYEYRFRTDSTRTDSLRKEIMNLDVFEDHSVYYGQIRFASDSIMLNSIIDQQKNTPGNYSVSNGMDDWNVSEIVKKKYPDFSVSWLTMVGSETLEVSEKPDFGWKISNEIQKIADYSCQKATVDFAGRKWTAWFTTEIPIPEGPYKFYGLPGLIVKITDKTGTHQFMLKGNSKIGLETKSWDFIEDLTRQAYAGNEKALEINRKQYEKLSREYRNDPTKQIRQELSQPGVSMVVRTGDGRRITETVELIRYHEEREREKMKRKNNPIELIQD